MQNGNEANKYIYNVHTQLEYVFSLNSFSFCSLRASGGLRAQCPNRLWSISQSSKTHTKHRLGLTDRYVTIIRNFTTFERLLKGAKRALLFCTHCYDNYNSIIIMRGALLNNFEKGQPPLLPMPESISERMKTLSQGRCVELQMAAVHFRSGETSRKREKSEENPTE